MSFLLSSAASPERVHKSVTRSEMVQVVGRPMNGGNGLYSYSRNSTFQRKAIAEELDIKTFSSSNAFKIADLGCSVGPNTILAVQNIIDAVDHKFQSEGKSTRRLEFQVFFNDQASNDFNQLFKSLPPEIPYFVAGVLGSFHNRLFPNNSLHFIHSSFAAQWLSRVPQEVQEKSSSAWNKGSVHYSNSTPQVIKAFEDQYAKDMDNFLKLRAQEIVHGGLMALILPGRPNGTSHTEAYLNKVFELIESSLIDMGKKGIISEEKIDSFNIPMYYASLREVESAAKRNGSFSIEIMENIPHEKPQPKVMSIILRAGLEGTIKAHFGDEILDELFDKILCYKLEESSLILESCKSVGLFVLLKRNAEY